MAEQEPISEFDRVLAEIARKRLGGVIPPAPATGSPVAAAVPGSGPSSIFAGPIDVAAAGDAEPDAEETWQDHELTHAEATLVPDPAEAAADAAPAVGAQAVHPEVAVEAPQGRSLPPAGWYPDPHNTLYRRWWNGAAWTDQVQALLKHQPRFNPTTATSAHQQRTQSLRDSLKGLTGELGPR